MPESSCMLVSWEFVWRNMYHRGSHQGNNPRSLILSSEMWHPNSAWDFGLNILRTGSVLRGMWPFVLNPLTSSLVRAGMCQCSVQADIPKWKCFFVFHVIIYSVLYFLCLSLTPCYLWKLPPKRWSTRKSSSLPLCASCNPFIPISHLGHTYSSTLFYMYSNNCFIYG